MTRRRFAFWIGMILFWISERVHASLIDSAAAAIMRLNEVTQLAPSHEQWTLDANSKWRWFERRSWVDGEWSASGITTPVDTATGQFYKGKNGYLDEALVPVSIKSSARNLWKKLALAKADADRRALGGLPPSQWLRSLNADEIRLWLKTIVVPEVGVDGMTFWTHLTRDHSFSPKRIRGLAVDEQAKLHSAAHYGY